MSDYPPAPLKELRRPLRYIDAEAIRERQRLGIGGPPITIQLLREFQRECGCEDCRNEYEWEEGTQMILDGLGLC